MSNQKFPKTDQQRDREIIIKWQYQTKKSCKTVNVVLRFVARNFKYKNERTDPPTLQIPIVRPHLEYEMQCWSPHFINVSPRHIDKIEKIQRRATKMIPEIRNHS